MNPPSNKALQSLLCAGAFIIWLLVSRCVGALPNYSTLNEQGLLMPLLCSAEFIALLLWYRRYTRHYADIPIGKLPLRQMMLFILLLLVLLASQSLYVPQESWSNAQLHSPSQQVVLFILAVVLLAPVYEEILFRGFILQGLLLWAPQQKIACSLLTSLLFAAVHTQYTHLQTLIALFLLSLLLCAARFTSRGLKLPICLHLLNNVMGVLPLLSHSHH